MQRVIRGEADHCRFRILKYCRGQGIDLGCGSVKIRSNAIGIDLYHPNADMKADARVLDIYPDGQFDYVFSSHLLEELQNTELTLKEWLRIIKDGGHLVLYQVDKEYYYPIGHPQCNVKHVHHFSWEELWEMLQKLGGVELVHHARYNPKDHNEWSFELVVRKIGPETKPIIVDKSMGISLLIPTLNRPASIEAFSAALNNTCFNPETVEIVFGVHADDKASIDKIAELKPKMKIDLRCEVIDRHPEGVHLAFLWNQLYPRAKYDIVGYFGDDVIFHTPGWDDEIRLEFMADKSIMVSCNDVHIHQGKTSTLFFTHKSVHDRFGFYLHPRFRRWYTDTFWDLVYRNAGKLHYREDLVTEHFSPDVFKDRTDDVYRNMQKLKGTDGPIWNSPETREQIASFVKELKNG